MASLCQVSDRLTCRHVLNLMVIIGFMLNYMLRVNLIIAIVAMVVPNNSSTTNNQSHVNYECYDSSVFLNTTQIKIEELAENINQSHSINPKLENERQQTKYEWNEYEINFVLGAFYWGYICTEVPGGRLAEVIGAKRVIGSAILIASTITLLTPFAATFGYKVIAALRVVLGFMLGATWPALFPLASLWIPPTERSRFMSNSMAATLGAAIMMQIGGFLIATLGWESVFYFTGGITFIWSIIWFMIIHDSPAQHPRISVEERRYIEEAIGATASKKAHSVPWKSIFTSKPVWAIILYAGCNAFSFFTILTQLPTYMQYILNYKIQENGVLSSIPYIGTYLMGLSSAILADYFHRKNKLSVTAIRKIFNCIGGLIPALCMLLLSFFGCDRFMSVTFFTSALVFNGALGGGFFGNALDIAPNYSGTIFGIANTLSSLSGSISSLMVGLLTYNNQTYGQWRIIFWILTGLYTFQSLSYLVLGSGELQPWNSPNNEYVKNKVPLTDMKDEEEVISLKEKM